MKTTFYYIAFLFLLSLFSCKSGNKPQLEQTDENIYNNIHKVMVLEVRQANEYTYLRITENKEEHWLAVTKRVVNTGDVLYFEEMLVMQNFKSKDLDTTFSEVFFINNLMTEPKSGVERLAEKFPEGKKPDINKWNVEIKPLEGGVSIAELYADKNNYSDKTVRVIGKVVKFSPEIMNRNWIHIQDGTDNDGKFDLTITTQDVVKVGEIVIFEGKISINKDFGAGYKYEIIMEEAKQLEEVKI